MPPITSSDIFDDEEPTTEAFNEESNEDCLICLEPMRNADLAHPILCPTKCGFNFCSLCIDSLIASSKDDYQEASDGNMHVKVKLHCPQCRGDLSCTIQDTLAVRKHAMADALSDVPDSNLSAANLRKKHAFNPGLRHSFDVARKAYERHVQTAVLSTLDDKGDEQGFEVDVREERVQRLLIDVSLFDGLELFMNDSEQTYVTELMTSGNYNDLAQAAQILFNIGGLSEREDSRDILTKNIKAKNKNSNNNSNNNNNNNNHQVRLNMETKRVRRGLARNSLSKSFANLLREVEIQSNRRLHPLPTRMPKFFSIPPFDPKATRPLGGSTATLQFADDEWDGSIDDAFARRAFSLTGIPIKGKTIKSDKSFSSRRPSGSRAVLVSGSGSKFETHISGPKHRVIVSAVNGEAGRWGISRGDVVSHVGGEPFTGNAEQLETMIERMYREGSDTFTLVVNADPCVAEVLKLRSLIG